MESPVSTRTLGDLVAESPARASLFDALGLDYCCHGQRTLAVACAGAGLDVEAVAGQLALSGVSPADAATGAGDDLEALLDDIVAGHHRYLRAELPALEELAEKVEGVHGDRHPELAEVRELVSALRADLEPHLDKEEMVLFPTLRGLAGGEGRFPFDTVANPIRVMGIEHEQAGELLATLRKASDGFTPPVDGCASYRSLYARLAHLEADTHLHIHKENNVLFPLVLALEAAPAG